MTNGDSFIQSSNSEKIFINLKKVQVSTYKILVEIMLEIYLGNPSEMMIFLQIFCIIFIVGAIELMRNTHEQYYIIYYIKVYIVRERFLLVS